MNPLLELCADVIVSAAARRSILVGCGSAPPVQKFGVGGCAARRWRPKNVFQRFLKKFRSKIAKLPNNKYTAKMHRRRADKLSAAVMRRSTKFGGGGAHKLSRRRGARARIYPLCVPESFLLLVKLVKATHCICITIFVWRSV